MVALGASAGGLEALEQFFAAAPKDAGLAFVVVQHLERHHPSLLTELLCRRTQMPVRQAADGDALEPNHVFVIPPNALLTVSSGILLVKPPGDDPRMHIDAFFRSLSEDRGELAAGVLLSGTGTDGTFGLRAIKEQGGLTLAQAPETAKHPFMPQNAIAAGFVDEVLAPQAMPARLVEHVAHLKSSSLAAVAQEAEVRESLAKVCDLLRRSTGHDFSRYKEGTLSRRIRRRIQLLRLDSVPAYLARLAEAPEEPGLLLKDLLIGVTQFFREPLAFESLGEKVIAKLLEEKNGERPIRIWVPGCATGEEAYSVAILLHEKLAALGTARLLQLFATDIDLEALAAARAGRYRADIAEQVSPERLARFFVPVDDGYQVVKELRDMCVFSVHNLIRDPPFSSLDLISCRNLLIYLEPDLQRKVVPLLHYALRPSGFLFLGSSEELSGHNELFLALDKKHRIFQRKETLVRPTLDFPLSGPRASRGIAVPPAAEPNVRNPKQAVLQAFERMLAADFAPASAIVDERGEILCLGGKRGQLLQPPSGLATNNLLDYAEATLRHALRTTLAEAIAKRTDVVGPEFVTEVAGGPHRLRVTVRLAPGAPPQANLYAVVVEDLGATRVSKAQQAEAFSREPMLEQLESELKTTRADLQAANEELEGTNEELKSSNEELISTNEELQSANEELQTSKEELQSVNEELETVNSELRQKVTELGVANSDLQNLFSSTQVATVFLDRELKLAKFTPAANRLFRFIDADVGRPLDDLAQRFAGTDLLADVTEVLRTLVPVEREIRAGEAWFILRVMPYRTLDDEIAGAVITFADVTKLKRAEASMRESERLLKDVIDGSPFPVFLKDLQGRFLTINKSLEKSLGMTRELVKGKTDYDLFPKDVAEYYREHDRKVAEFKQAIDIEEVADLADGHHDYLASKFPLFDSAGRIYGVGAISHEITGRKRAEELVRRYAGLLRLSHDAIFVRRLDGEIEFWNDGAERLYGFTEQEALGKNVHELLQTKTSATWDELSAILATVGHWEGELEHRAKDGRQVTVSARMQLVRGEDGVERVLQSNHDITERKRAEEALRESERRYSALFANKTSAIAQCRVITDEHGRPVDYWIATVNEAFERIIGVTKADVEGRRVKEVFPGVESVSFDYIGVLGKVALEGGQVVSEVFLEPTGQYLSLYAYCPMPGEFTAIFTDITERKRAEEALRQSEERYRSLFSTLIEGFCIIEVIFDAEGRPVDYRFLEINPAFEAQTGLHNVQGRLMRELAPEHEAHWFEIYGTVALTGKPARFVNQAKALDRWYDVSAYRVGGPESRRVAILFNDITERMRAEDHIRHSREGLKYLAEASVRVMRQTDLEPMFQSISEAALELTGGRIAVAGHGYVSGHFVIGGTARVAGMPDCPPGKVFAIEKGGVYMELLEGAADTLRLTDAELRADPRWGGLPEGHVPMRGLLGVRLVDRQGRSDGMLLVTDKDQGDFTADDESLLRQLGTLASLAVQHVEARVSLEQAGQRKNEFLAMLSHELRNPLAPIKNGLYLLEHATPDGDRARRAQSVIGRQVAHLVRLVDDLLDVTRITRGKIRLEKERLDLAALVDRTVEDHRAMFADAGLELTHRCQSDLWIEGDKTRISQVVGNLLNNALKFTPRGGSVSVLVERSSSGKAVIAVQDTGVGVGPEILPRLFDPFTQADRTLDRTSGGLGLGLALVKGLVEQHGGSVAAHSGGPGKGALFEVVLPPLPSPSTASVPAPTPSATLPIAPRRVLIIEDNRDAADSLREVLELGNHSATVAYSAEEGMAKARSLRPDFVLCDIGLPGTDGYQVARTLRADPALASTTLIALTGYAAAEDVTRSRAAGFDHHLAKPPSIEAIERILTQGGGDAS